MTDSAQAWKSTFDALYPPQAGSVWSSKMQYFAQAFWTYLKDITTDPSPSINSFVRLVDSEDRYMLVAMVIPEFRIHEVVENHNISHAQQSLLDGITHLRNDLMQGVQSSQMDIDLGLFAQEKATYRQQELYRAKLFVLGRGNATENEDAAIQEWLSNAPLAATASAGPMAENNK